MRTKTRLPLVVSLLLGGKVLFAHPALAGEATVCPAGTVGDASIATCHWSDEALSFLQMQAREQERGDRSIQRSEELFPATQSSDADAVQLPPSSAPLPSVPLPTNATASQTATFSNTSVISSCPDACKAPACMPGDQGNGGALMIGQVCTKTCSRAMASGTRFCGAGTVYEDGQHVDCSGCSQTTAKPNILVIVADDLGWANAGWHNKQDPNVVTTALDQLVEQGLELDRMYVYKYCSPTRSSILSGRLPIHVTQYCNYESVPGGGVPIGMTLISEKLQNVGYETHMIGKWNIGSASRKGNIPVARGFNSSLHYFEATQDHITQESHSAVPDSLRVSNLSTACQGRKYRDLWRDHSPARDLVGRYSGDLWTAEATRYIRTHGTRQRSGSVSGSGPQHPFFMYLAFQNCHGPLQVPQAYLDRRKNETNDKRRRLAAMAEYMSDSVGNITQVLQEEQLWNNTLIWFLSDNGGALGSGNNYPLRGGKVSDWEGGVRVTAFVSGGFLPLAARGRKSEGLIHGADIYATLAEVAGADPVDYRAAEKGLPPIDSLSMWPLISQVNTTSPRIEIPLSTPSLKWGNARTAPNGSRAFQWSYMYNSAGALIVGDFKLIVGVNPNAVWTSEASPNNTAPPIDDAGWMKIEENCGDATNPTGCLFNIREDPSERVNLASDPAHMQILLAMQRRYVEISDTVYDPDRGDAYNTSVCAVYNSFDNWVGPYLD